MIRQDRFDAVLLDLRSAHLPPDQMVSAITELRPSLVGRVLVITGEVSDPDTLEMLERYAVPHISRSRVTSDLWGRLRTPCLGFVALVERSLPKLPARAAEAQSRHAARLPFPSPRISAGELAAASRRREHQ